MRRRDYLGAVAVVGVAGLAGCGESTPPTLQEEVGYTSKNDAWLREGEGIGFTYGQENWGFTVIEFLGHGVRVQAEKLVEDAEASLSFTRTIPEREVARFEDDGRVWNVKQEANRVWLAVGPHVDVEYPVQNSG